MRSFARRRSPSKVRGPSCRVDCSFSSLCWAVFSAHFLSGRVGPLRFSHTSNYHWEPLSIIVRSVCVDKATQTPKLNSKTACSRVIVVNDNQSVRESDHFERSSCSVVCLLCCRYSWLVVTTKDLHFEILQLCGWGTSVGGCMVTSISGNALSYA